MPQDDGAAASSFLVKVRVHLPEVAEMALAWNTVSNEVSEGFRKGVGRASGGCRKGVGRVGGIDD